MPSTKKITLKQVAELAQVSTATVDRVLNSRGGVSKKKENKVLDAARSLNIDRNLNLVNLEVLRFAILLPKSDELFYKEIYSVVNSYQEERSSSQFYCSFLYFPSLDPQAICSRILNAFEKFDGMIIVTYEHPLIKEALERAVTRIPVISMITDISTTSRTYFAGEDNRSAGRLSGDFMGKFLSSEKGKIIIITERSRYLAHEEREMGFRQVLREKYPYLSISHVLELSDQPNYDSLETINSALSEPGIVGVYAISQKMTKVLFLSRNNVDLKSTICICHGVSYETNRLLMDGLIDIVIDHNPKDNSILAIDYLLSYHKRIKAIRKHNRTIKIYMQERLPT